MNYQTRLPISLEEQRELSKQYGISFEDFEEFRETYKQEHGFVFKHYRPSSRLQDWKANYYYKIGKIQTPPEKPGFNYHITNYVKTDKCIEQQRQIAKRHYHVKHNKKIDRKIQSINERINNLKKQLADYECSYKLCVYCGSVYNPNLLQNQKTQNDDAQESLQDQNDSCQTVEMT